MSEVVVRDKGGRSILQVSDDGGSVQVLGNTLPHTYSGRAEAQIAAIANLLTIPVSHGADQSFLVSGNVRPIIATTHAFTMTCSYTDEGGTARVLTLTFGLVAGGALSVTSIANANGTVPYMGVPQRIRCKKGTTIVFATTGTFTTVTYNAEAGAELASAA